MLSDVTYAQYLANFDVGNIDRIHADISSGDSKVVIVDRTTESPILELDLRSFFSVGAFIYVIWSQTEPENAYFYDSATGISVSVLLVNGKYKGYIG